MLMYILLEKNSTKIELVSSDSSLPNSIEVDIPENYLSEDDYDLFLEDGVVVRRLNDILAVTKSKQNRLAQIDEITVTTSSGKTFDGDEKSQDRMIRAITIAQITGQTTTTWKLADNTKPTVTLDELKEAVSLAGQATSNIILN